MAAISEKDAHIALLEMTPNSNQYNIEAVEKLTQEKIQLQKQLSEVVSDHVDGWALSLPLAPYGIDAASLSSLCVLSSASLSSPVPCICVPLICLC